jgi:hypothetical protein
VLHVEITTGEPADDFRRKLDRYHEDQSAGGRRLGRFRAEGPRRVALRTLGPRRRTLAPQFSGTKVLVLRLGELSSRLGDADWLDDAFIAGDVLMVTVLSRLNGSHRLNLTRAAPTSSP